MREVDLGCGKALLVKEGGEFYALGHKCPHYGAPLVKGQFVLTNKSESSDYLKIL